jgi:hypothetical protein
MSIFPELLLALLSVQAPTPNVHNTYSESELARFCIVGSDRTVPALATAKNGSSIGVLVLVDPPTGPGVDCSLNTPLFALTRQTAVKLLAAPHADKIGIWLPIQSVDTWLHSNGWRRLPLRSKTTPGDVVLSRRPSGQVRGLAVLVSPYRPQIHSQPLLVVTAKHDGSPPQTAKITVSANQMLEFWSPPPN